MRSPDRMRFNRGLRREHLWLSGLKQEAVLPKYGGDAQTYIQSLVKAEASVACAKEGGNFAIHPLPETA